MTAAAPTEGWLRTATRFEASMWRSLALGIVRRRPGAGPDDRLFPYRSPVLTMIIVIFVSSVIEIVVVELALPWKVVRLVLLVISVWGLVQMTGYLCSLWVYQHVVGPRGLRLRSGPFVDVVVDAADVLEVRRGTKHHQGRSVQVVDGVGGATLVISSGGQTAVEVRLTRPVEVPVGRGSRAVVNAVRVWADDAPGFVAAVRELVLEPAERPR